MNLSFNCRQVHRALSLGWFNSVPIFTFRLIIYALGVISFTYLAAYPFGSFSSMTLLLALVGAAPTFAIGSFELYMRYLNNHPEYLNNTGTRESNILNGCDYDVVRVLLNWRANKTWAGLINGLIKNPEAVEVFYRLNLPPESLRTKLTGELVEAKLVEIVQGAIVDAKQSHIVSIYHFLRRAIFSEEFTSIRHNLNLQDSAIDTVFGYYQSRHKALWIMKSYWMNAREHHTGGIARDWAVSYTLLLDQLTSEIPPQVDQRALFYPLFSREKLLDQIVVELNKQAGNNVLLVGEQGTGRTEIFYHLASRIIHHETGTDLDGLSVRVLDVQRLLSSTDSVSELQQLLDRLFNEIVKAGNVVLFIDQISLLISPSEEMGTVNAGKIIESYLNNPDVKIVGTIGKDDYLKLVKSDAVLSEAFQPVEIGAPSSDDLLGILLSQVTSYENRYHVFFTVEGLSELIHLAARYIKDEASPQRELHLIEEAAVGAHAHNLDVIGEKEITAVIEQKAQVPIQVKEKEQTTLLNLEAELHKRVVGQERPIKLLTQALMRSRAGLSSATKPVGAFLFLGPTGVGKTETAKALATSYYGSESKMVRLDMTEYADETGLQKLLGTNEQKDPGALALAIRKNPSTVVLLDEVEKSHQYVKNALLQLLDEGKLTTNYGKILDCTNAIIVATSNAGSDLIRRQVSAGVDVANFEKQLIDQLLTEKVFLAEFLNRFDAIIVYRPLTPQEVAEVVEIQLNELKATLKRDKGLTLEVAPNVIAELAKRGYDPVFGARALERVIKNELETIIAREIIQKTPQSGTTLTISTL